MSSAVATVVLASIPSPDRGVWYLGPIPIRAYALCIIAGIVVAVLWGERRFVARGGQPGTVTDIAVYAVPFGLVGGRLYHVATDWQTYFGPGGNPWDAFKIWQGGLGIWGAIALGAVGAWLGCRRHGVPLPFFADAVAPGIVTAQAIGRLGNWFNQELYGAPTTLPWGLEIYRRVDPDTGVPDSLGGVAVDRTPVEIVQPTFLYELIWNLLVAALVVWADRRFRLGHGRAFAVYVAGYTAGRFWIEQMRTDYATRVFGDLRINVVVSALVFLGAVAYLLLVRKPREVLPGAAAPGESDETEPVPVGVGSDALASGVTGAAIEQLKRRPPRLSPEPAAAPTSARESGPDPIPADGAPPVAVAEPERATEGEPGGTGSGVSTPGAERAAESGHSAAAEPPAGDAAPPAQAVPAAEAAQAAPATDGSATDGSATVEPGAAVPAAAGEPATGEVAEASPAPQPGAAAEASPGPQPAATAAEAAPGGEAAPDGEAAPGEAAPGGNGAAEPEPGAGTLIEPERGAGAAAAADPAHRSAPADRPASAAPPRP